MRGSQKNRIDDKMKTGEFVYIDYIARIKDTGEIFDLTKEEVARKEKIYNEKIKYSPIPVIVDGGFVIAGLNDALKEMKVGEKKKVVIEPGKAFGERSEELVKLIPEARFKEQGADVVPGYFVNINNLRGRVVSIDGGRVKVDFNHPLAGKTLEYDVEIVQEIKDNVEKIKAIVYYFTGLEKEGIDIRVKEKVVEIEMKDTDIGRKIKSIIASQIVKWIQEIETVKFIDVFKKAE
jgi:FKBP-type peptidyl-prolyl cis-trans isomerase 2